MNRDPENRAPVENVFAFANPKSAASSLVKPSPATAAVSTPSKLTSTGRIHTASKATPSSTAPKSVSKTPRDKAPLMPSTPNSTATSDTREAARAAKMQLEMERLQKVAMLKEKWAKEREQKAQFYQEKRQQTLQKLQEQTQQAAEFRKKNLDKQREIEDRERQQRKEQLAVSLEARAQLAKDLETENKARRRISVFLNTQMRKKAKEREEQLQREQKEAEESLLASRRLDTLQLRAAKQEEEERRRESLLNRTLTAQEQKRIAEELAQKKREEEAALLDLRRQNWADDLLAKQSEEQRRRDSIAHRIEEWRKQRTVEEKMEQEREQAELERLTVREEEWRDVRAHKDEIDRQRRESLALRLDKWREEKSLEQRQKEQEDLARSLESELNTLAREDVAQYRRSQEAARRQSLSYRLDKARKDRDFEEGQKALRQVVLEEEKRLQDLDRQDVQNYRQKIIEARRQSLEYRNQVEFQECMRKEGEKQAQQVEEAADRALREQAWRDVKRYREQQREEQRKSLAWRLADAHRKHEMELAAHEEKLNRLHLDLQCRREDWLALQEHKKAEAERRRLSVSVRLESWRKQRVEEERTREKAEMEAEEDAILREMDREELVAAKLAQDMMDRHQQINTGLLL